MIKIIQNKKDCIGCGTCAALCPKFWDMDYDEMKAILRDSIKNEITGSYEIKASAISDEDLECNKNVADACPVQVITIKEGE